MLPDLIKEFQSSYICPKCHSHQANVQEIVLVKAGRSFMIPSKDTRYLEVTCMLCGYTEFFNRAVYLASKEVTKAVKQAKLPRGAKEA